MGSFGDDGVPVDVGGTTVLDTPAQVQAQFPGNTATPTANFSFVWNGAVLGFNAGDTFVVTPDLLAALQAASAPIAQP